MTYRELKDELAKLSDSQLDQKVILVNEDGQWAVEMVWVLEEDYINPSGEGMEPVSMYADDPDWTAEEVANEGRVGHKDDVLLLGGDE
jgi:hypothetical protein